MLDLVDGPLALVCQVLQTTTDQHRARYVVALDAPHPALATLDPRQLLGLAVKLLDLLSHAARLLSVPRGISG